MTVGLSCFLSTCRYKGDMPAAATADGTVNARLHPCRSNFSGLFSSSGINLQVPFVSVSTGFRSNKDTKNPAEFGMLCRRTPQQSLHT
jgi:hypothetical protein